MTKQWGGMKNKAHLFRKGGFYRDVRGEGKRRRVGDVGRIARIGGSVRGSLNKKGGGINCQRTPRKGAHQGRGFSKTRSFLSGDKIKPQHNPKKMKREKGGQRHSRVEGEGGKAVKRKKRSEIKPTTVFHSTRNRPRYRTAGVDRAPKLEEAGSGSQGTIYGSKKEPLSHKGRKIG